jgi:hypothetical protein
MPKYVYNRANADSSSVFETCRLRRDYDLESGTGVKTLRNSSGDGRIREPALSKAEGSGKPSEPVSVKKSKQATAVPPTLAIAIG